MEGMTRLKKRPKAKNPAASALAKRRWSKLNRKQRAEATAPARAALNNERLLRKMLVDAGLIILPES